MLNIKRTGAADYDRFVKALICGDPGSGKTLISSTFPDPLYLTTEGLLMSVADRDVAYQKIKSTEELLFIVKMLEQPAHVRAKQFGFTVNTCVVDTIDDVSHMFLTERMKGQKYDTPQLQDYGWLKEQMTALVTALRNLDMNVVLTCHLKSHDDGGLSTLIPAIDGGFAQKVAGFVDLAVVLRSKLKTSVVGLDTVRVVERFMQTFPDPQLTWIKDHSGKLPQEFPINFEDDYDRLTTIIYGAPPDLTVEIVPEPETVVEVAAVEEPEPEGLFAEPPVEDVVEPRFTCSSCGEKFDDEDQRDRGKIKYQAVLCLPCFNKKSQKRSA